MRQIQQELVYWKLILCQAAKLAEQEAHMFVKVTSGPYDIEANGTDATHGLSVSHGRVEETHWKQAYYFLILVKLNIKRYEYYEVNHPYLGLSST